MAVELMGRIMSQPRDMLDSSEKLVLIVMADRCDQDGVLWYAVDTICHLTSFTRKAVQRIIARLEGKGLLRRMKRSQKSNFYQIMVDRLPAYSIKRRPTETRLVDLIEEDPTLFGIMGVPETPTPDVGVPETPPGRPSDASGGVPETPDSLIDPIIDSLRESPLPPLGERVVAEWNILAGRHDRLPAVGVLNDVRRRAIDLRAEEYAKLFPAEPDPGWAVWSRAIESVGQSKLLTGLKTDWHASFDWVVKRANFLKIMEGNYGRGADVIGAASVGPGDRSAAEAGSEARRLVERARQRGRTNAPHP